MSMSQRQRRQRQRAAEAEFQHASQKVLDLLGHIPPPPLNSPGYWVIRDDFNDRKSFGYFRCKCGKWWQSAHAFPNLKQSCQRCEKWSLPELLWHNVDDHCRPRERQEQDDGPHDRQRCEACRKGVCTNRSRLAN